ncbi:MAG: dihydrolipoamide acetyltransferase family protein [Marmoricola sp.]
MSEYLLPDVGEGLTEADILTWRVAVGDVVAVNDIVVEIETAKSVVELPSPYAGEVLALLVNEGDTVTVGTPIIRIGDRSEVEESQSDVTKPPPPPEIDLSNPGASGGGEGELLVGRVKEMVSRRRRRPGPAVVGDAVGNRPLASPAVRKHARDSGIDLAELDGSGPDGNVTHADVEAYTSKHSYAVTDGGRREPVKGVRRAMAQAMVASAFSAPHVTEWLTVDVSETVALTARLRERPDFAGARVSTLLILAKACIEAIGRTPIINSTWDEKAAEVVFKDGVNLGIAAATPRGLIVPNIKHAQSLTVRQLAAELKDLVDTAREGKTPPADSLGGSFTITNVGPFGVDGGTPIINPGESAILCFGAITRRPWVVTVDGEERLAIRDVCTLSLSFDHRHIDGEAGSRFLADVAGSMQDPSRLDLG